MKNSTSVLAHLVVDLDIPVTKLTIDEELQKHPNFGSLLALSDVLNTFQIPNAAYRVKFDDLHELHSPFVAYVSENKFLLVNRLQHDYVTVSNESWSKHRLSLEEFKNIYSGSVLIAEKDPKSGEADFIKKQRKEEIKALRIPMCIVCGCLVWAFILLHESTFISTLIIPLLILTLVKTFGVFMSVLLLIQSVDANNPLIQKICGGNSKYNCNAILSSNAATIFDWLSWSEVGFFYFSGTWLFLIFSGYSTTAMCVLLILNFICLPYTFYSIYYQAIKAKKWCVLCCTIQVVIWLEFILLVKYTGEISSLFNRRYLDINTIAELFICFLSPIVLWALLKPLLLNTQQLKGLKGQLREFKYNADLFNGILRAQPKYLQPDENWCIVLGNATAKNCITMVSNPYCAACVSAHKLLNELLAENSNIHARLVFTTTNNENDIKNALCRHLVALNESTDRGIIIKALHDWYNQRQKDYAAWAKDYPVNIDDAVLHKIEKHYNWCSIVGIAATPTLLVNGYRLPEVYRLNDLKYMLT